MIDQAVPQHNPDRKSIDANRKAINAKFADSKLADPKIIVALDFATKADALELAAQLDPDLCRVKVGKELFTRCGPAIIEALQQRGFEVFLDLKFFDIPNTVAKAVRVAQELGVWMLTLHASGGQLMLQAALENLRADLPKPLLIAVTVLTSWQQQDLSALGITQKLADYVARLALLAQQAGMQGCVCSGLEAAILRQLLGKSACLVTPGIRPANAKGDDQQRILTAAEAIKSGATYLVIGRPITQAANPLQVLELLQQEINTGCF